MLPFVGPSAVQASVAPVSRFVHQMKSGSLPISMGVVLLHETSRARSVASDRAAPRPSPPRRSMARVSLRRARESALGGVAEATVRIQRQVARRDRALARAVA